MSDAQSENSVRIIDGDDVSTQRGAQPDMQESEGSEHASEPADLLDHASWGSDDSGEELEDELPLNGDGTLAESPLLSPPPSQSKAKTPKMKDGKPICEHKKNTNGPHQRDLCEGCKIRYGVELCTMEKRLLCRPVKGGVPRARARQT